ncbi:MAG TPA: hypothetical protein VJN21_01905 [Candidatus Acidoferrales bacterium]|nr:hypothetical protein [Candidatus Acidoferrales bacterium]
MTKPVLKWLHNQSLLTKVEFGLPWGICDLVGLSFNQAQVMKRLSFRQHRPIGPMKRVELLRHIPDQDSGQSITLRQLKKATGESVLVPTLDRDLAKLISDGFVVPKENGALQKLNGWAPIHDRIVAVELKLSRISGALSQALSNRAFATESYVALPKQVASRFAENARYSQFKDAGIGVLGVTRTSCRVIIPAQARYAQDDTLQMHCVERFWRTRDSSSSAAARHAQAF